MVDYLHSRVVIRKKLQSTNTWVSEANGIVLTDTSNIAVSKGLGKKRDTFAFNVRSPNNQLFETFHDGDGSTTAFTLKFSPIDSEHLTNAQQKLFVYVGGVLQEYTTDYTVSGSTLTFTTAPASGSRNIRVVFPVIETDDLVDIYRWKNNTWGSMTTLEKNNARLEEGKVSQPMLQKGKNSLSVKGYGSMDVIFSGMAFALTDNSNVLAHTVIQKIIAQLNQFNQNRKIYGQNAAEWADIGNDVTTTATSYSSKYKPAIEMIEELSGNDHTKNGQYIYWVDYNATDNRYEFHWKAKSTTPAPTITEGIDPKKITVSRSIEGVINVVIYNVGLDCYGNGQEYLNYDFTITGFGSRWKYISKTDTITQNMINQEFEKHTNKWDTGNDNERTENFPTDYDSDGNGYWEFQFTPRTSINDGTFSTNAAKNVTNDKGFNEQIRLEAYWQGKDATQSIIDQFSNPRFKATLPIPASSENTYTLGGMYTLDIPAFNLNSKKLRLVQIDYEFGDTILKLEEDETTVGT